MARALQRGGHAHERLALRGVEALDGEHDRLAVLQALGDGGAQQLLARSSSSSLGDAPGEQRCDLREREQRCAVLDQAVEEARRARRRRAGDDSRLPGE